MAGGDTGMDCCVWPSAGGSAGAGSIPGQAFSFINLYRWFGGYYGDYLFAFGFVYGDAAIAYRAGLAVVATIDVHGTIAA